MAYTCLFTIPRADPIDIPIETFTHAIWSIAAFCERHGITDLETFVTGFHVVCLTFHNDHDAVLFKTAFSDQTKDWKYIDPNRLD